MNNKSKWLYIIVTLIWVIAGYVQRTKIERLEKELAESSRKCKETDIKCENVIKECEDVAVIWKALFTECSDFLRMNNIGVGDDERDPY